MNKAVAQFIFLFLALSALSLFAQDAPPRDALTLRNGDLLYGELLSFDSQNGIRWRHADAREPLEFASGSVAEIELPSRRAPAFAPSNACRVRFTSGDSLKGNLIGADRESLLLDTWYAGQLKLARSNIQSICLVPPPAGAIFSGPTGLEGWTHARSLAAAQGDPGQWTYRDGAFYASKAASIARDLKLPDVASVEFDLNWKESLHIAVALYCDSLLPVALAAKENEPDFGGFYSFQLNSYFSGQPPVVDLLAIKKHEPIRYLGQMVGVPVLTGATKAHVELRMSKPGHFILLLINDTIVKQWVDSEFVGQGACMRFVHQGQGKVKLSNLRVSAWNGYIEQTADNVGTSADVIHLRASAPKSGTVDAIAKGKLLLAAASQKIELPLADIRQIDFLTPANASTNSNPANVSAFLTGGGNVSIRIERWDGQGIEASSPLFGKARFTPSAFTRLQFAPK